MDDKEKKYHELLMVHDLNDKPIKEQISFIGELIDISNDLGRLEGLNYALTLISRINKKFLKQDDYCNINYSAANCWSSIKELNRKGTEQTWDWEQEEIEKEVFHLRSALIHRGFSKLNKIRKCQIYTNLANSFDHAGRVSEALEYYTKALLIKSDFGMAIGNRGISLYCYASTHYDSVHINRLLQYAYFDLKKAIELPLEGDNTREVFKTYINYIDRRLSYDYLNTITELDDYSLGITKKEKEYRMWCLKNILFLNSLNDIGPYSISASDILSIPSIVVGLDEGPYFQGLFDQMKQEFVSARYLYYEGISNRKPHFSDKDVLIYNTFDYPEYGLSLEIMKSAYRMTYSIFDKIGFFLNLYLNLNISNKKISFRNLWYEEGEKELGLAESLIKRQNWLLRGLYWLSKDLYENKREYNKSIEPEAKEIAEIRNYLEHKCLKVHNIYYNIESKSNFLVYPKGLVYSIKRDELEQKTLKLIKLARAALIYLLLGVHQEEIVRRKKRGKENKKVIEMRLTNFEDKWKR